MTTDPIALLRDAENYLSALHGSVARHDHLAANLACAGCELRDRIAAALPELAAVSSAVVTPPTDQAETDSHPQKSTAARFLDAFLHRGPGYDLTPPHLADQAALRDRIAEALISWTYRGKEPDPNVGILETVRANAYSRADAVLALLPAPADWAAVLTGPERAMLRYALDQAQERIWSEDGFTDEDQAAVTSLRRLADDAQPAAGARQDGAQP